MVGTGGRSTRPTSLPSGRRRLRLRVASSHETGGRGRGRPRHGETSKGRDSRSRRAGWGVHFVVMHLDPAESLLAPSSPAKAPVARAGFGSWFARIISLAVLALTIAFPVPGAAVDGAIEDGWFA